MDHRGQSLSSGTLYPNISDALPIFVKHAKTGMDGHVVLAVVRRETTAAPCEKREDSSDVTVGPNNIKGQISEIYQKVLKYW